MALRSYLYLDEDTVNDYLSEIESGVLDGPISVKKYHLNWHRRWHLSDSSYSWG